MKWSLANENFFNLFFYKLEVIFFLTDSFSIYFFSCCIFFLQDAGPVHLAEQLTPPEPPAASDPVFSNPIFVFMILFFFPLNFDCFSRTVFPQLDTFHFVWCFYYFSNLINEKFPFIFCSCCIFFLQDTGPVHLAELTPPVPPAASDPVFSHPCFVFMVLFFPPWILIASQGQYFRDWIHFILCDGFFFKFN